MGVRRAGAGAHSLVPPGAPERLLLRGGCFQAAAGCQDRCPHRGPDHDGLALRDSPAKCQRCGTPGRGSAKFPRAPKCSGTRPRRAKKDLGMWWPHCTDGTQGPFPSAQDYWHKNGDSKTPVPAGKQQQGEDRQMDDQQMLDVIGKRSIGSGALPPGTLVRAEVEAGFAHGGLRPYARLCAAVEWDGCVWHATPGSGWVYWWNPPAAEREDEAVAAGVITRESRDGVVHLRLADVSPARQVQDLRNELESAAADAAALADEEGDTW